MSLTTAEKNITTQITGNILRRQDKNLTGARAEAFAFVEKHGFPSTKQEEFKYTALTRELEKNFRFPGTIMPVTDLKNNDFFIPGLDANILVFINGVFSVENSVIKSPASQLSILPLKKALETNDVARGAFEKYINSKLDAYAAWNTADWDNGIFIHVSANTIVDLPVMMYYVNTLQDETTAINRNLVVLERSSELSLLEKYDSQAGGNHFTNVVTEVMVQENAGLNYYNLQNNEGNHYHYGFTSIYQQASSRANTYTFTLNGKLIRNNLHLVLDGEGIESHMYGLYLLTGNTLADNHTVVDHRKPNSYSNEFYKGIIDDRAKGVFNGKIYVRPDAQKTNAFQANRNILLTDNASINTKPQLEIWADDVKCSHGCTSGQLDEEAVFYLQARGISKETARAMMLYAFAGEVLEQVKNPAVKEYLDALISERLHKNF